MKLIRSALFVLGILIIVSMAFFVILQVRVVHSDTSVPKKILDMFVGTNLLFTRYDDVVSNAVATYPQISEISVEKMIPSTLILHIKENSGVLAIHDREKYIIVDKNAQILRISDSFENMQVLEYFRELPNFTRKIGSTIPFSDINYALKLQHEFSIKNHPPAQSFSIPEPKIIELTFNGNTIYIVSTEKSVAKNASLVHNIQQVLKEKNIQASAVDLRFGLPVIKK